jgi:hypothetical protein
MPRIADCGWLMMMGVATRLPLTPWHELVFTRTLDHLSKLSRDFEQAEPLHVANDRDDQAFAFQRGGDADVDRVRNDQGVFGPSAVRLGHLADCVHACGEEISRERQRHALRLKLIFVSCAMRNHGRQVSLEHRSDMGRRVQQALHHPLGNALAHA